MQTRYFIMHLYWHVLSRRPIAKLFDGLRDRRENRAVGAHNRTIGCDFKESDGIIRTLTCQTRSDGSHLIVTIIARNALWDKYYKNRIRSVVQWERKIGWNLNNMNHIRLCPSTPMPSNSLKSGNETPALLIY